MRTQPGPYLADADRWLCINGDEILGMRTADAVDVVLRAGLTPHVADHRGAPPDPGVPDPGRVRLLIGDDGRVRRAKWG